MKKIAILLLALVYTVSVFGVTISRFYCCGKLASVSVSSNLQTKMNGKNAGHNCCKTVKTTFKVKDNHLSAKTDFKAANTFALITPVFFIPAVQETLSAPQLNAYDSQAPPVRHNPLYILYSNYRI